jgi:maleylacetate reductase
LAQSPPKHAGMTTAWTHTGYAQRIHFGLDAIDRAGEIVKEAGGRRALLVTTVGRRQSESGERLMKALGKTLVSVFDGVRSHVPTTAVQAAVAQAQATDVDAVVSFGGGSCADLGKALCFFVEQQAGMPGASYVDRPALAHVSVPTTYSGAELTPFFGMTDEAAHRKSGAGGPTIAPLAAIYDPVVTMDTPAHVSAETGMNALAHGVECAYSPRRTPEAEAIALACIQRVAAALPDVVDDPGDVKARTAMLEGAVLGGRCLQNTSMGVHHGLSQLIGGRTGMAHGLANAILLSHALRFNAEAVPAEVWRIGTALGDPDDPAAAVDRLRERIGLPARLSDVGFNEDDIEAIVRMAGSNANIQANPRRASAGDLRAILEAAF